MSFETSLLADLYNALEKNPASIYVHERLLEVWLSRKDEDMATGIATTLLELDPGNECAMAYLESKQSLTKYTRNDEQSDRPQLPERPHSLGGDLSAVETELEKGYTSLKLDATLVLHELKAVSENTAEEAVMLQNLNHISEGHVSAAVPISEPPSAREAARTIMADQTRTQQLLIEDFEMVVEWMRNQKASAAPDAIRNRLVRRKTILEAALPATLSIKVAAAFAAVEREILQKRYVNSTTMITGEPISSIRREDFFVSEDNYAWDMEELVQAISSNDGVMRNPLSKQLFTESDIQAILAHGRGQALRPMQEAQHRMRKGFRPSTIDKIEKLGNIMLQDQSSDGVPSRHGIDEFLAYVTTLPSVERQAINTFKIPATDRHSRQAYDYTVGESLRDAKSNTTCSHKIGDFLSQAGPYLRRQ